MSDPHVALRHVAESAGLAVRRGLRGLSADGTVDGIEVQLRAGRTPVVVVGR